MVNLQANSYINSAQESVDKGTTMIKFLFLLVFVSWDIMYASVPYIKTFEVSGNCEKEGYEYTNFTDLGLFKFIPNNFEIVAEDNQLFLKKYCGIRFTTEIPEGIQVALIQLPIIGKVNISEKGRAVVSFHGDRFPVFEENYLLEEVFTDQNNHHFFLESSFNFQKLNWSSCGQTEEIFESYGSIRISRKSFEIQDSIAISSPWFFQLISRSCSEKYR